MCPRRCERFCGLPVRNAEPGKAARLQDLKVSIPSDNIVKSKYSWWPFNTDLITKLTHEKNSLGF